MSTALWPTRWPAIAKQECVDQVQAAPAEKRQEVKWELPCAQCDQASRCLNAKRKEIGPLLYDREILTRPRSSESSLFPLELLEAKMLRPGEALVPFWHKPVGEEWRYGVATGWDVAWSEKIGGDYLVKITGVVDRQTGLRRVLDIRRWQRKTFGEQVELVKTEWGMFRDDVVVIESDFSQKVWAQHIANVSAVPVMPHAAAGKSDMAAGIPSLIVQIEQGKWALPYTPGSRGFDEVQVFISELEAFGWNDGKLEGVGEHDDTVMAWYHLSWALDRLLQRGRANPDANRRNVGARL